MVKTRGQKTVVKFFPHEVSDMEPACEMLHFYQSTDYFVPYILVLWLSIIVLVPFDLTSIDSLKNDKEILVKRIINLGRGYLLDGGKIKDGATIMLAKLITRPDVVRQGNLDEFMKELADGYIENRENPTKLSYITSAA
jgi:hypothetical protein